MKKYTQVFVGLLSIIFISQFLWTSDAYAETLVEGDISADATWTADKSPYVVSPNGLTVESGVTLTIEPSVVVKFDNSSIVSYGNISAVGTVSAPIYFTSITDDMCGDTNGDGTATVPSKDDQWKIYLYDGNSTFSHVMFRYSNGLLSATNARFHADNVQVNDASGGFSFNNSQADVTSSSFIGQSGWVFQPLVGNVAGGVAGKNSGSIGSGIKPMWMQVPDAKVFEIYGNSILRMSSSTVDGVEGAELIRVYDNSLFEMSSSSIIHVGGGGTAVVAYNYDPAGTTTIKINDSSISIGYGTGVSVRGSTKLELKDSSISGFDVSGITADDGAVVELNHGLIAYNDIGIQTYSSFSLQSASSSISGNRSYGLSNNGYYSDYPTDNVIGATGIWWGDATGPYQEINSVTGKDNAAGKGNSVTDGVLIGPWLTEDPFMVKVPTCCSSVAFIPGLEASRLYTTGGIFSENQLWEPNRNADVEKLYLDKNGKSVNTNVYTRDVIGKTNYPLGNLDVYRTFNDSLDKLVKDGRINSWKALPYDWRLGLGDVVSGGVKDTKGNISYLSTTTPDVSYMISQIQALASSSVTGKVTLVTHSNGGLVAKVLIQKLQDLKTQGKSDLVDHIDRVVMISAPQLGSVDAIATMLHGYGLNYLGGIVLNEKTGRAMAENMPGGYNLLPSQKYFDLIKEPLVTFATSTDTLSNFSKFYGRNISDYDGMKKFLLGADGRKDPAFADTITPNVLSASLLAKSEAQHTAIDSWQFPASIEVTQVAGWGADTLKGIMYQKNSSCSYLVICKDVPKMAAVYSSEGDGTVLYPSALESQGKQLYFNLSAYNNPDVGPKYNRKHSDILEADSIKELVKNVVTGSTQLPKYITETKPQADKGRLLVSITASTTLSATDTSGNTTSLADNPNPNSDVKILSQNIPNSFYADFGDIKYVGLDTAVPAQISIAGNGYGTFTFSSVLSQGDAVVSTSTFTDIPITPQLQGYILSATSSAPVLALDVDGNGTIDATTTVMADFDPILYLEVMKKTIDSFDLKKPAEKLLIVAIDRLEKLIKQGKIKNAAKQIKVLVDKVKHTDRKSRRITPDERNQLVQMLSTLVNNLI